MTTNISFLAAFIAGVLSISSPCVLPLVPIYLAHIAGVSAHESGRSTRWPVMRNAIAYVLGFSAVFVILGAALGAAGAMAGSVGWVATHRVWLVRLGGALLTLLGLYQVGLISIPLFERDHRLRVAAGAPGSVTSSFLIGFTFGAGWSPCVGPILGAILTMAAGQGDVGAATVLLIVYSAGLGVPFLAAAFAFGSAPAVIRRLNGRLHLISTISGAVMLGVGAIMLLGIYQILFTEIIRAAPWTPWEPRI